MEGGRLRQGQQPPRPHVQAVVYGRRRRGRQEEAAGAGPLPRRRLLPGVVHVGERARVLPPPRRGGRRRRALRGYRLAPEHRLPTAVDDGVGFLRWLSRLSAQSTMDAAADGWLTKAADFGRVFVTGDSAGGTIAHHLAVRAGLAATKRGEVDLDLRPVTVRGYVLLMPFFGGVRRTRSEAECPAEVLLNLDLFDRFWRLSLPAGATRDHQAANPFGPDSPELGSVDFRAPVLVVVGGLDMMRDRTVDYAERLAAMGKPVELVEFAGKPHGFYLHEPGSEATGELIGLVSRFLHSCEARLLD
ncbi:unnamed protein product [Miscanthus lutarioriparius]|uniref:Alpha/beta hydrolase fold-3 domain-containing protein n=1 Tax=Miscanthus lutarioriparius TaxID=422564 RepID=A0A811NFB0_9POAL|nr:unnamed protein product [Miscanthus lutarioriparius]